MAHIEVIDHQPASKPDLFTDRGRSLNRWLKSDNHGVYKQMRRELAAEHAPGFVRLLDRLSGAALRHSADGSWTTWRQPYDSAGQTRVFSPMFDVHGLDLDEDRSRLHFLLPAGSIARPKIHIEKLTPEGVFEGQEIAWEPGATTKAPHVSMILSEGFADAIPGGTYETYWNSAVKTVVAAVATFEPFESGSPRPTSSIDPLCLPQNNPEAAG